jgi:hypothetical protein
VRCRTRGNMRISAPIILEPGPDRISPPKRFPTVFSDRASHGAPPPEATCKSLEALLGALEKNTRAGFVRDQEHPARK